jgi:outer membrane protein OmpA-like peptidoglycan-associated protein
MLAVSGPTTVDEAEFEPSYDEARPEESVVRARSSLSAALAGAAAMTAADVRWAADAVSPDYRHIGAAIDTKTFTLTPAILGRLILCNRFSLDGVEPRVVFGLRGCTLEADVASFSDSVVLREIEPNHIDYRCVICVLDNINQKLTAFQASTVPNWEYMEKYRQNHAHRANMLPTGGYIMVVGTHRPKKKNAAGALVDNPGRIQGALRQDQLIVVLRSEDNLTYTVKDTWDATAPSDNIHPGIVAIHAGSSTLPDFSSAGCSTLPGGSSSDQPSGAWADFRKTLGLDNSKPTAHDGKRFAYVLLTGREARLTATGGTQPITRLRFGSRGDEVKSLQDALAKHARKFFTGKSDGTFGAQTSTAFIKYQKQRDSGAADAIVTPADATALGFSLASPPPLPASPAADVKPLGLIEDIVDRGKRLFNRVTRRAEEGRFKVTSDVAELLHQDTAATVQWSQTSANFTIRALAPSAGVKDVLRSLSDNPFLFKFRLEFEHNGFDIKNARILREIQGSTEMKGGKFETTWTAKNATPANVEKGRIDFLLKGLWDPGLGDKSVQDFSGKLWIDSAGGMRFDLDPNAKVKQEFFAGGTWSNFKVLKLKAPELIKKFQSVFFDVNKHVLENQQLQVVKNWLSSLKPIDQTNVGSPESVRWQRLRSGAIVVNVEGHASATGSGPLNQALSGKRADAVIKLLRDELGTGAKLERFAHGEDHPEQKKVEEALGDRRVDIWYLIAR